MLLFISYKPPTGRPMVKGIERRRRYGLKGSAMATLVKTIEKKSVRAARQAERKLYAGKEKYAYTVKKTLRADATIAFARAMDAIHLDPRNSSDRKLRAQIHRLGQKVADLQFESLMGVLSRKNPAKPIELHQNMNKILEKVFAAKGWKAAELFNKVYYYKMSKIELAHKTILKKTAGDKQNENI